MEQMESIENFKPIRKNNIMVPSILCLTSIGIYALW